MRSHQHELGIIKVPGPNDSLAPLKRLASKAQYWAADTETTGLNSFAAGFKVRLVQMGTRDEAWLLRPYYPRHMAVIKALLEGGPVTYWHNWVFDALAVENALGLDWDAVADRARCTDIYSRIIDPRPPQKGGVGHKLEQLMRHYLGTASKKESSLAMWEAWGRPNKVKKNDMWPVIPDDLPEYEIYAGQDVLGTSRLAEVIVPIVDADPRMRRLAAFEQPFSRRIARMQRLGMPFDNDWATKAETEFDLKRDAAEKELIEKWKVEVGGQWAATSASSLKEIFGALGAKLTKRTQPSERYPDGQISLDKEVLKELSQTPGDIGDLANVVFTSKRNKHYGDYIRSMRSELGTDGHVHPNVRPMQAATARMSVSNPPVQQLPRDDIWIRGCLLADPGQVILAADYAQVEFRVGAAYSQDPEMKSRIINGDDLHAVTAAALFGAGFNKQQRQASKPIGFGRLYLGSAKGIRQQMVESDTTGYVPPLKDIERAIKAFDRSYRVQTRWAYKLKDLTEAAGGKMVTLTGRPLIVDKAYAAPNYAIQSAARDVFAAGINKLHKAGLGDRLRLVVHDEIVLSIDPRDEREVMSIVHKAMGTTLKGIPITTEAAVKGERWQK
jgi:DNA polymerase I